MMRQRWTMVALGSALGLSACADPNEARDPFALGGTDGGTDGTPGLDDDGGGGNSGDDAGVDDDTGAGDGGPAPADGDDGGVPVDCSPAWATPWIGSPCTDDADCSFAGGQCLREADGFPCGTCTQPCGMLCPDEPGTPTTFCVAKADVGLGGGGTCLSQCDGALLGGDGCRDGYACEVLARVDGTAIADVCIPDDQSSGEPGLVTAIDHEFLIEHFGGHAADAFDYSDDVAGLQAYLDDVGVVYTSAAEIVEPYNQAAATMCGYSVLLPARDEWEKIGALGLFTDVLTDLVGEPIFMRNWWRPPCYNEAVGGAPGGDHPDADAVDLDFLSPSSRAMAQKFLCEQYWDQDIVTPDQIAPGANVDPRLNMSVGLGGVTIHLGVLSAGGRRSWTYDSYTVEPSSGTCW